MGQEVFNFILLSFVCYRVARLFAIDEGPTFWLFKRGIFLTLRVACGVYDYGENGEAETALGRAMGCPYCLGIWLALPLSLYATGTHWYIAWFAIAGGQAFLQGLTK